MPTEVIDLADTLINLGHPNSASRVVASFTESHTVALTPWQTQELDELTSRIERAIQDPTIDNHNESHLPLMDAIRQALTSPST